MKLVNKRPLKTADASASKGSDFKELLILASLLIACLVGIYYLVGFIADLAVQHISLEKEKKIFSAFTLPAIIKTRHGPDIQQIKSILDKLTKDKEVVDYNYSLFVVDMDQPNAFAIPGGKIAVTSKLLETLNQEVALAFVLAHELGHFKNRDHLKGIGRAIGSGIILSILLNTSVDINTSNLIQTILISNYSRKQEEAADRFAVGLIHRTYKHTNGINILFKILKAKDKRPEWAYMFLSHPSFTKRIKDLESHANSLEDHGK